MINIYQKVGAVGELVTHLLAVQNTRTPSLTPFVSVLLKEAKSTDTDKQLFDNVGPHTCISATRRFFVNF